MPSPMYGPPLENMPSANGYPSSNNGSPPSSYDVPLIENGEILQYLTKLLVVLLTVLSVLYLTCFNCFYA